MRYVPPLLRQLLGLQPKKEERVHRIIEEIPRYRDGEIVDERESARQKWLLSAEQRAVLRQNYALGLIQDLVFWDRKLGHETELGFSPLGQLVGFWFALDRGQIHFDENDIPLGGTVVTNGLFLSRHEDGRRGFAARVGHEYDGRRFDYSLNFSPISTWLRYQSPFAGSSNKWIFDSFETTAYYGDDLFCHTYFSGGYPTAANNPARLRMLTEPLVHPLYELWTQTQLEAGWVGENHVFTNHASGDIDFGLRSIEGNGVIARYAIDVDSASIVLVGVAGGDNDYRGIQDPNRLYSSARVLNDFKPDRWESLIERV